LSFRFRIRFRHFLDTEIIIFFVFTFITLQNIIDSELAWL
jgi:hypothetical protein